MIISGAWKKSTILHRGCYFALAVVAAAMTWNPALAFDSNGHNRIWIDTDAACGYRATADPDDCFALLVLAQSSEVTLVGVSTVFGNAPLADTDRITRHVLEEAQTIGERAPVHRGYRASLEETAAEKSPEAVVALRVALQDEPLRIVALGPLTNVAAAIRRHPELAQKVTEVVAVMGKREGHLFHPSEGARAGIFGHGPIFRDLNFCRDASAARILLASGVRVTLVPYELARQVSVTTDDLARFERAGGSVASLALSSRGWLAYWRAVVGRDGFYPFDLLAAAYVVDDRHFGCAPEVARVAIDQKIWPPFLRPISLLVGGPGSRQDAPLKPPQQVTYCTVVRPTLRPWLLARLGAPAGGQGDPAPGDESPRE